jgi:hypothetical protein
VVAQEAQQAQELQWGPAFQLDPWVLQAQQALELQELVQVPALKPPNTDGAFRCVRERLVPFAPGDPSHTDENRRGSTRMQWRSSADGRRQAVKPPLFAL